MCYSAQIRHDFARFVREFGAVIDIDTFMRLYWQRGQGSKVKVAKALDAQFARPQSEGERAIKDLIERFDAAQTAQLEQDIFKQRKRLADAERTLLVKTTKKALEDKRIATQKVAWALDKLAALRRTALVDEDSRIFPGWYAPVLVSEGGRRVVKPMRYQCRPAGTPAFFDTKFPGTYNARRDSLEKFWRGQFGTSHGIMVVDAFFENVSRHTMERRVLAEGEAEQNVVLEFRPQPAHPMLVACLWSEWRDPGGNSEPLLSFAAITDDPPAEIAAAGHDRCIVPIKPEHLDAWLDPDAKDLATLYAILDDRDRPYYEHRLAA